MKEINSKVFVTQPFLPPLEEFTQYLNQIWENKILTNNGPFHVQLEKELCDFLGIKYISLFSNGTLALITALQALRITGEVITTPFSFVATTHALWWNNIKPVFADVEPETFTLDPKKIEAAITPMTTAILPVHVYGYPCKIEAIKNIADTYGLKIIYDAAHTFGAKYMDRSLSSYGDLSILSFHATKVFNTFEGGAIVSDNEKTKQRIDFLKNFGYANETTVVAPGINAKMNEFQAALGLIQLKYHSGNIIKRKLISEAYAEELKDIRGISLVPHQPNVASNYSYFPIFVNEKEFGMSRDALYGKLKDNDIYGRRYFYPLISQFPIYRGLPSAHPENLPIATQVAESVICLPIYPDLKMETVHRIIKVIKQ
jgi:dTDP-4-amino-4,6-dideoxygalactose transaminase